MTTDRKVPERYITSDDRRALRPIYGVWEVTLGCDQRCRHCGSSAGRRRDDELTTAECKTLIRDLQELGTRELTLMGGEAYLRSDWLELIAAVKHAGMTCSLLSGGRRLSDAMLKDARDAGLDALCISIDGLADVHDDLRGVSGSFDAGLHALRAASDLGLPTTVNTTLTPTAIPQLGDLFAILGDTGIASWRLGYVVPSGRSTDLPELLLHPYELLDLMPILAELFESGVKKGIMVFWDDGFGYYGPYEHLLRGGGDESVVWQGCHAGVNGIGIESHGQIKGCTSLPPVYRGGSCKTRSVGKIWKESPQIAFGRDPYSDELWGFCSSCYYADICQGGCTWTSHALFGKPGNNPYCHHRVLELHRQGLRERLRQLQAGKGAPYDHGLFELILETTDGKAVPKNTMAVDHTDRGSLPLPERRLETDDLVLCRECERHVYRWAEQCPHCGVSMAAAQQAYERRMERLRDAQKKLIDSINELAGNSNNGQRKPN